jgi:hypothetical protein
VINTCKDEQNDSLALLPYIGATRTEAVWGNNERSPRLDV